MVKQIPWGNLEEDTFLLKNKHLQKVDLYEAYCKKFGCHRTVESVDSRRRRLKQQQKNPQIVEQAQKILDTRLDIVGSDTDWLLDVLAAAKNRKLPKTTKYKKPTSGSALVIHLSDLHFGKKTPIFDIEIGSERLLSLPSKIESLISRDIDCIHVVLTGDLIDGEMVYKTQQISIEAPAIRQIQKLVPVLWQLFTGLRKKFKLPTEVHMVHGNHGKTHPYAHETTNYDNVVALMLHMLADMNKDKDLLVHYTPDQFVLFKIKDKKVLMTHEGVKHGGTPAMKIRSAGWRELFDYDILMQGHYHSWQITDWHGKPRIVCGCLCGGDDYSTKMALGGQARQGHLVITTNKPMHSIGFFEW